MKKANLSKEWDAKPPAQAIMGSGVANQRSSNTDVEAHSLMRGLGFLLFGSDKGFDSMNITKNCDSIRQHQPGQFRRAEDGKKPYAHVKGQKLDSKEEREKSSVYVNNKNVTTFKNPIGSDSCKLFDTDAGLKLSTKKLNGTNSEKKLSQQYDKTGKTWITTAREDRLIDQWV